MPHSQSLGSCPVEAKACLEQEAVDALQPGWPATQQLALPNCSHTMITSLLLQILCNPWSLTHWLWPLRTNCVDPWPIAV